MELTNSERVLRAITTLICARDIIGVRDSKMALDNTIFSCPLAAGGSDELEALMSWQVCLLLGHFSVLKCRRFGWVDSRRLALCHLWVQKHWK